MSTSGARLQTKTDLFCGDATVEGKDNIVCIRCRGAREENGIVLQRELVMRKIGIYDKLKRC